MQMASNNGTEINENNNTDEGWIVVEEKKEVSVESESEDENDENSDESKEEKLGCQHYKRKCQLVGPCCGRSYTCRFCHDEKENHQLVRTDVVEVVCLVCQLKQNVSNLCTSCKTVFGNYFCPICRLYDDVDRKQFHCVGCGICRVGGRENFFHCEKCGLCLTNEMKDHRCVENSSRSNCPVCLEDIHSSRITPRPLPCGHLVHKSCFDALLNNGNYTCPLCNLSMINMNGMWEQLDEELASTPMPTEYVGLQVKILCRDCHKESQVVFHIVALKCTDCGSYNTARIGGIIRPDLAAVDDDESPGEHNDNETEEGD